MALDAAAVRADELTTYSAEKLVYLLSTTHCRADYEAVAGVLSDRESKAAQTEAQLQATLADAQRKAQDHEDLHRASLAKAAEDSARVRRIAQEEARSILKVAVSEIHEAGKKMQDEVFAHLNALLCEIDTLGKSQREVVEKTEAKLKASFAKIHSLLEKPEGEVVPIQTTPDDTALALARPSIGVAQQRKQTVVEMVKVNKGVLAAADGSVGKSLKRKAGAVENRGASPVQISATLQERMAHPPGFSPTPRFNSSSRIYGKADPCSSLSQAINVGKEVASAEGSGKTVTLKEPTPLEVTGDGREYNAPSEATQDKAAEEPAHLGDESMSLITVPVQQVRRFDMAAVSKRGRGRGRTVPKEKEKSKKVSGGSGNLDSGRGRGRGRGRSNTSGNLLLGTGNLLLGPGRSNTSGNLLLGIGNLLLDPGRSNTSGNLLLGPYSELNRPSPVLEARTVHKYSERTENASQSRILPSNASAIGQAEMNIISGQATAGTRRLIHLVPRPTPLKFNNVSVTQLHSISGMGGKVTENLGKCIENKQDSVPMIDNAAEGISHEDGDVGTSSNGTGGTSHRA